MVVANAIVVHLNKSVAVNRLKIFFFIHNIDYLMFKVTIQKKAWNLPVIRPTRPGLRIAPIRRDGQLQKAHAWHILTHAQKYVYIP